MKLMWKLSSLCLHRAISLHVFFGFFLYYFPKSKNVHCERCTRLTLQCNLFVSLFPITQAKLNFPKYCEPIVSGEAGYGDVKKLWRNIEPILRKALNTVYLHEVSSSQWEQMQEGSHGLRGSQIKV